MEELIRKEDSFTAWRAKINRTFGVLSGILSGTKEESVLSSENGIVEWKPVKKTETKAETGRETIQSLHVDGILNALSLAVTGAALFTCRIDAPAGMSASSISAREISLLDGTGRTAFVKMLDEGLAVGGAVFGTSEVKMPPAIKLDEARISCEGGFLSFSGTKTPLRLNIRNGGADFPQGLSGKEVSFPNGKIDGESYTGCAAAADKLKHPAEIFGHPFDGTEPVSGSIDNCTGISFTDKAEISFKDSLRPESLAVANGEMKWSGAFIPSILYVEASHYCEWYPSNDALSVGDVISLDMNSAEEAYCKAAEGSRPLAVVAEEYSLCIGKRTDRSYPACSRGRVPAKVEGRAAKGDMLVLSSTAGVLRAATSKDKAGKAWAVALESSESEAVKLVKVHIL